MNKLVKIYLTVVTVLLLLGIGLGVYVWYTLQTLNSASNSVGTPDSGEATGERVSTIQLDNPIVIEAATLPDPQRKALEAVGLGDGAFTITQSMVTCAEDALGAPRMEEILAGAAPTPLESLKLLPCAKR